MWHHRKFILLVVSMGAVVAVELLSLVGAFADYSAAPFCFLLLILIVGHQTLKNGIKALFFFEIQDINLLMCIAIAGAVYLGKYEEAFVVVALYSLAEKLEAFGVEKSQSSISHLVDSMPQEIPLKNHSQLKPVREVQIGEIVILKPGDRIPLDGKIVFGVSFVDESPITGEPIAQEKFPGDLLFAGSLNKQGYLEMEVTKRAQETAFAKIQELIYEAAKTKVQSQKFIERFATFYTPSVIILCLATLFFPLVFFQGSFDLWLQRALSLLVIACPCALVISTPISVFSAIAAASKAGVLVKGGSVLETLAKIKVLGIDKTKTLTLGTPCVTDVIPYGKATKQEVLECAAGIEIFSEHPLAQSIVEEAKRENFSLHLVENFKAVTGKGAQADCLVCSEKKHVIGKLAFILETHDVDKAIIQDIEKLLGEGKTVIAIASMKEVEGLIALSDKVRADSLPFICALKKRGILPILLTGDHWLPSQCVAQKVGIEKVQTELLPEDKMESIKALKNEYGIVGMLGDGINDAPAMSAADVGITFGSIGSDTAIEASSVVILNHQLLSIAFLIDLGKAMLQTIKFNLSFAIFVKCLFILLALMGWSNLSLAIFADVGVTLIVIVLALRLGEWKTS